MARIGGRNTLLAVLGIDIVQFQRGMRQAERIAQNTQRNMQRVGRTLTMSVTAPIAAGAGLSIKAAADFDKSMTKITTLVGINREQVQAWSKDLMNLSGDVARGPTELAEGLFVVTSAGLRGAEAMEALGQAAKASVVGLGSTEVIARTAAGAIKAFSKQNLGAAEAIDVLVATVRYGNLEVDSLAQSLGRVMSIAAEVGVTFHDVGAFVATFTRAGVNAEIATTSLRALLTTFIKPTQESGERLRLLGTNIDEVRDAIQKDGLALAMFNLLGRFEGNLDVLGEINPNIRALAGALATAKSQGVDFIKITRGIEMSLGLTNAAFEETKTHASFALNQMLADLERVSVVIGNLFLPKINEISANINALVDDFVEMDEKMQKQILGNLALAAAAGPAALGIAALGFVVMGLSKAIYLLLAPLRILLKLYKSFALVTIVTTLFAGLAVVVGTLAAAISGALVLSMTKADGAWTSFVGKIPIIGPILDKTITEGRLKLFEIRAELKSMEIDLHAWSMKMAATPGVAWSIPGIVGGAAAESGLNNAILALRDIVDMHVEARTLLDERLKGYAEGSMEWWQEMIAMFGADTVFEKIFGDPGEEAKEILNHMEKFKDIFSDMAMKYDMEGSLFGKAGAWALIPKDVQKMATSVKKIYDDLGDEIVDAMAFTDSRKFQLATAQGLEELKRQFDEIKSAGKPGDAALKILAHSIGAAGLAWDDFVKAFTDGRYELSQELAKAGDDAKQFGDTFLEMFTALDREVSDALAFTDDREFQLGVARGIEGLREAFDELQGQVGGQSVLKQIGDDIGAAGSEWEDFVKAFVDRKLLIKNTTEEIGNLIKINVGDKIADTMSAMFSGFLQGTRDLASFTELWSNSMISIVEDMFSQFIRSKLDFDAIFKLNLSGDLLPAIIDFAKQAMQWIGSIFGTVGAFPSGPSSTAPPVVSPSGVRSYPTLSAAGGAIVTGPTSAIIGDNPSGKEAIIPLERWAEVMGSAGGGPVINIHAPTALSQQNSGQDSSGKRFIEFIFEGAKGAVAADIVRGGDVKRAIESTFGTRSTGGI